MRLGMKSVLLFGAGYALLVAGLVVALDRWLREFEDAGAEQTAMLLARENAAQISERAFAALEAPDEDSRRLLRSRLEDIVLLSEVVSSLTVVDAGGRVVASDSTPTGRLFPKPDEVFGADAPMRVRGERRGLLGGGTFLVDLPIVEEGRLAGYVEVGLRNERISSVYLRARWQLLLGTLVGFGGVVLLGVALQLHVNRRTASITRTLEEVVAPGGAGMPVRATDEFSRALHAASRAREALLLARQESTRIGDGFRALAQVTKVGVLLLSPEREVAFANPRALELLGCSTLDELRATWRLSSPPLEPLEADLAAGAAETSPRLVEFQARGGPRRLRVEAFPFGGQHREVLALLADPDVLDTLETDVRLASQLEGLARAYRTLAHEVRAPLSAIMINLDLLRESLAAGGGSASASPSPTGAPPERHAAVLRRELLRLNRTLSEVLTQTLPAREAHRFELVEAVAELGTLLAPQARRQGVELRMCMPEEPIFLVGQRDRLKQALLNVAVNALEALSGGGRLEVKMVRKDKSVTVSMLDDGPGIPDSVLSHIYEPDFTTKGNGSGIGLYVARSLVELHGGRIRVESEVGSGTNVEIELPLVAAP